MDTIKRESVVLDFLRALGLEPDHVSEVHITPVSLTVHTFAVNEAGHHYIDPRTGDAAGSVDTYPLWSEATR